MTKSQISIIHQNIQCISNKVMLINENFKHFDILLISEHWQKKDQISEIKLANFKLLNFYCREWSNNGGVAIYKNDNFSENAEKIDLTEFCDEGVLECCGIKIASVKLILVVIYRPPNGNFEEFLSLLHALLTKIVEMSSDIVIGGDFNVDFSIRNAKSCILEDLLASFNVLITSRVPTRVTAHSATCIDNFFVKLKGHYSLKIQDFYIADHKSQVLQVDSKIQICSENEAKYYYTRRNCMESIQRFRDFLKQENWADIMSLKCADQAYEIFIQKLMFYYDSSFPLEKVRCQKRKKRIDRITTPELEHLKLQVAFFNDLSKINPEFHNICKQINKYYRQQLSVASKTYYDNLIENSGNKTKTAWDIVREIQKDKEKKPMVETSVGYAASTELELADQFNKMFTSLSKDDFNLDNNFTNDNIPMSLNTFFMSPVSEQEVVKLINSLKNSCTCALDNISNNLLKQCSEELCNILSILINMSTEQGIFPSALKIARVTPIFKTGDQNDMKNYRAISILSSLSKLYELNIKEQMTSFLICNKSLSTKQHGFMKRRSTETALCEFHNYIIQALDQKQHTLGLFVDFSKAFDCVNHQLLLLKLERYGIRGLPLNLMHSYLSNRKQVVKIGESISSTRSVESGVPQGSVLGPFLYLVFANDLLFHLNNNENVKTVCYADDTNVLIKENSLDKLKIAAELTYSKIIKWSEKNGLKLNKIKTKTLLFTMKTRTETVCISETHGLATELSTKMLGIIIDYRLTWEEHVDILCQKLRKNCYGLRSLSNYCSEKVLVMVYYANIHSHIKYGILNWGNSVHAHRVFIVQKYAIRILARLSYHQSCREAFKHLKILTVASIYILQSCIYAFNNKATLNKNRHSHNYATRHRETLQPKSHRTSLYQNNFEYLACKLFNKLPQEIKTLGNIKTFKNKVQGILSNGSYYSIKEFLENSS